VDLDHFAFDHAWYFWLAVGSYTENLRIIMIYLWAAFFYIFFPCFGEDG
jgi:hypothetical protein